MAVPVTLRLHGPSVPALNQAIKTNTVSYIVGIIGPPGAGAPVSMAFYVDGPFSARQLIAYLICPGSGILTAETSSARSIAPPAEEVIWSVTKNGTYAVPEQATSLEIGANLFATITFAAHTGIATIDYVDGGDVVFEDLLYFWESAAPDAAQARTAVTLTGV